MKSGFTLAIPNPCSEDWNSFTPTETGGFCSRCRKNVIDFTKATDDEIIAFMSKKPTHTCGRFTSSQLKTYTILQSENVRPDFMLLKAGVASLLLLLISKPASTQVSLTRPSVETYQTTEVGTRTTRSGKIAIRGKVISSEDSVGIPGASVVQKGMSNGVFTDIDGAFELIIEPDRPQILIVSFIGYVTEEVKLEHSIPSMVNITLFPALTGLVGEVIVLTGEVQSDLLYTEKESRFTRFWKKITGKP